MKILPLLVLFAASFTVHAFEIPPAAAQFERVLIREAQSALGPNAPVATLAGQVQQESRWDANARSPVGAQGLAQFMPGTAAWIPSVNAALAPADPFNPHWSIRALVTYDAWLVRRNPGATPCETWAFALSSYNGGETWLRRDRAICAGTPGCDSTRWFGHVEKHSRRAGWAFRENRGYPSRILTRWAPVYAAAGWGPAIVCP